MSCRMVVEGREGEERQDSGEGKGMLGRAGGEVWGYGRPVVIWTRGWEAMGIAGVVGGFGLGDILLRKEDLAEGLYVEVTGPLSRATGALVVGPERKGSALRRRRTTFGSGPSANLVSAYPG